MRDKKNSYREALRANKHLKAGLKLKKEETVDTYLVEELYLTVSSSITCLALATALYFILG
jgi:hypothetical protein